MRSRSSTRMFVMLGLAGAYMLVLTLYGSPLLAFTTWMGWVDPQPLR